MSETSLDIWFRDSSQVIPASTSEPAEIVKFARLLTTRDMQQVESAFRAESYEMVSTFVLHRALVALKQALGSLGLDFIGEMLNRADLGAGSTYEDITNHEAISLAHELGMFSATKAMRLRQCVETVSHFASSEHADEIGESDPMTREEAVLCLRASVEAILGQQSVKFPYEFIEFRKLIEERTFKADDQVITTLVESRYFFKKTTLSFLLSRIKNSLGAQLEHVVGNVGTILPLIWKDLRPNERWQVGDTYRIVYSDGNEIATLGLKRVLLKLNGFDYVPETLRSHSFSQAAAKVLSTHESVNNFYNEPGPMSALASMGSTIPYPAFPICMTATLSVYLGNAYGHCFQAEGDALGILSRLSDQQWSYFIKECLQNDTRVLFKLAYQAKPQSRWLSLITRFGLGRFEATDKWLARVISATSQAQVQSAATNLLNASSR